MIKLIGAGDSIMHFNKADTYPQTGWFQVIDRFLKEEKEVKVLDFAENGRSTKSFIDEGLFDKLIKEVNESSYVFISFGHNDEKDDVKRHTDPFTTYKDDLRYFINEVRKRKGTPILLSSVARMNYVEGKLTKTHGDYPLAMEELAREENVIFVPLSDLSFNAYKVNDFEFNRRYIMSFEKGRYKNYLEGKDDHTHLTYEGAMLICSLVIDYLKENNYLNDLFI